MSKIPDGGLALDYAEKIARDELDRGWWKRCPRCGNDMRVNMQGQGHCRCEEPPPVEHGDIGAP